MSPNFQFSCEQFSPVCQDQIMSAYVPHTFSLDAADRYYASFLYGIWSHTEKLINISNLLFALLLNCESVMQHTRLLCPWDSLGKNTGLGCHSFLQGRMTQGQNPGLLHCRQILYCLSHQEVHQILTILIILSLPFELMGCQMRTFVDVTDLYLKVE